MREACIDKHGRPRTRQGKRCLDVLQTKKAKAYLKCPSDKARPLTRWSLKACTTSVPSCKQSVVSVVSTGQRVVTNWSGEEQPLRPVKARFDVAGGPRGGAIAANTLLRPVSCLKT